MKRSWFGLSLLVAFVCAGSLEGAGIDLEAERRALMASDRALFDAHEDIETFVTLWDEDATFMAADVPLARGEDIRATWQQLITSPGFHLEWRATSAHVAEAADLGYTLGTYELTVEQEGIPMLTIGKYVTLWKKQADGTWKVIVDCFNADGPPTAASTGSE